MLQGLRPFAFALAFVQLLVALIGFSGVRPARENHAPLGLHRIDVALAVASIARLPNRTVEASKPDAEDGVATLPIGSIVPSPRLEHRTTRTTSALVVCSRIVAAPRARAPPHRA